MRCHKLEMGLRQVYKMAAIWQGRMVGFRLYIGWLKIQMEMGVSLNETRTVKVQWLHALLALTGDTHANSFLLFALWSDFHLN